MLVERNRMIRVYAESLDWYRRGVLMQGGPKNKKPDDLVKSILEKAAQYVYPNLIKGWSVYVGVAKWKNQREEN